MTILFNSNHFHAIIYIPNSVLCEVSCQKNQVSTTFCEKSAKKFWKP